jgi:hypothetical protein
MADCVACCTALLRAACSQCVASHGHGWAILALTAQSRTPSAEEAPRRVVALQCSGLNLGALDSLHCSSPSSYLHRVQPAFSTWDRDDVALCGGYALLYINSCTGQGQLIAQFFVLFSVVVE